MLRWYRQNGHLLYITWTDFKITRGERVLQAATEQEYDMPIGSAVVAVFGGPCRSRGFWLLQYRQSFQLSSHGGGIF